LSELQVHKPSDSELLEAIRQGNEAAFSELFKRYWKKLHNLAYDRLRSDQATKEIVQELFVSLWTKRESLSITHLQSYLYAAVKNRVLNHLESQMIWRKHWDYYMLLNINWIFCLKNQNEYFDLIG
jgi:DNA-directed RNA polymerase specialized sigma24 family protein